MRGQVFLVVALLGLVGCQTELPPDLVQDMAENCGAEQMQDLIGQPKSVLDGMALARSTRIIAPGTRSTLDYVPTRLNIFLDDKGIITDVRCG